MKVNPFTGKYIDERMYLLQEGKSVILIDAVTNKEAEFLLDSINPEKVLILLTHEHIDHIYGVNVLRDKYPCQVLCSKKCSLAIRSPQNNFARYREVIMGRYVDCSSLDINYCCEADITFEDYYRFAWEGHVFELCETPGHSPGSICILCDGDMLFTGDTLLKEHEIITKLPGGSRKDYKNSTLPYLNAFSPDVQIYPGHGESGRMNECTLERVV